MERFHEMSISSSQVCPYATLEVNRDASLQEIEKAYRRLSLLYHPRRSGIQDPNIHTIPSQHKNCSSENDLILTASTLQNATSSLSQFSKHNPNDAKSGNLRMNASQLENESDQKYREIEWRFLLLNAAFETLSDSTYRKRYDEISNKKYLSTSNSGNDNMTAVVDDDSQNSDNGKKISSPTCGNHINDLLATCSPTDRSKSKRKQKYGINHLKHYANYLGDVDDDDTTVNTLQSSCTFASSNVMLRTHSDDFGGPLSSMYIARNHIAFIDPYRVFNKMFYSDIFHTTDNTELNNSNQSKNDEDGDLEQWRLNFLMEKKQRENRSPHQYNSEHNAYNSAQKPFKSFPLNNISNIKKASRSPRQHKGILFCGSDPNTLSCSPQQRKYSSQASLHSHQTQTTSTIINGSRVLKTIRTKNGFKIVKTEIIKINPKTGKNEKTITVTKEEIEEDNENGERIEKEVSLKDQLQNWFDPHLSESETMLDNESLFVGLIESMKMPTCERNTKHGNGTNTISAPSLCDEIKRIINSCGPLIP